MCNVLTHDRVASFQSCPQRTILVFLNLQIYVIEASAVFRRIGQSILQQGRLAQHRGAPRPISAWTLVNVPCRLLPTRKFNTRPGSPVLLSALFHSIGEKLLLKLNISQAYGGGYEWFVVAAPHPGGGRRAVTVVGGRRCVRHPTPLRSAQRAAGGAARRPRRPRPHLATRRSKPERSTDPR